MTAQHPNPSTCECGRIRCTESNGCPVGLVFKYCGDEKRCHADTCTAKPDLEAPADHMTVEGWEERFDSTYGTGMTCGKVCIPLDLAHVKSFIRQQIEEAEARGRQQGVKEGMEIVRESVGKVVCVETCRSGSNSAECYAFFHDGCKGLCVCRCHKYIEAARNASKGE